MIIRPSFRSLYLQHKAEEHAWKECVKSLLILSELYIIALIVKVAL